MTTRETFLRSDTVTLLSADESVWPAVDDPARLESLFEDFDPSVPGAPATLDIFSLRDKSESANRGRLGSDETLVGLATEAENYECLAKHVAGGMSKPNSRTMFEWQFLGFDVTDVLLVSALTSCSSWWPKQQALLPPPDSAMSIYGLVQDLSFARNLAMLATARLSEHGRFFPVALFALPDDPGKRVESVENGSRGANS